jgi:hypothetical protein
VDLSCSQVLVRTATASSEGQGIHTSVSGNAGILFQGAALLRNRAGVQGVWVGGEGGPVAHQGALGDGPPLLGLSPKLKRPVIIECDNKAAISFWKDRKEKQLVKHIDIIHHFARDRVASGELSFVHCKSEDNVSDCLTKALAKPLFEKGLAGLGMCVA